MKTKILLSALFTFSFFLSPCFTQVPQGFNYQAIARDNKGNPITNSTIKIKLSILTDTSGFYATGGGNYIWEEEQTNVKTNAFGLITVVFGDPQATKIQGSAASFSAIDWAKTPLYIGTKIASPTDYKNLGTAKLWSVPYSMVSDSTKALLKGYKLSVVSANDGSTDALFEVKRKDGQTVFAVYPNAVNVYVPKTTPKGVKGGFAIGGFDGTKITPQDYFRVTPDSVRVYIDKTPNIPKGTTKGGFAIGGFDQTKNTNPQDLLTVSNDSIRMYINDLSSKGATKGGFAIGGFDQSKGSNNFMNVSTDVNGIVNPSQNRILWYPLKNAFLTGKVLVEKPDSVGQNSFASGYESKAPGQYSQAMGFKPVARGNYSTAIGKNATASADNSFAFGDSTKAIGSSSYAFGAGAVASGNGSFSFGSIGHDTTGAVTGTYTTAQGDYSFSLGQGSTTLGKGSVALGMNNNSIGDYSISSGSNNTSKGYSCSFGSFNKAYGSWSTAIGHFATANGDESTAIGNFSEADGTGSVSIGAASSSVLLFLVSGLQSARGNYSTAIGHNVEADSYASIVVGQQNIIPASSSPTTWVSTDPLFVIGNGNGEHITQFGPPSINRSNALVVLKNGFTGIGTSTPGQIFDIAGGNGRVQSGYNWLTNSDIRYKKNIITLDSSLEKVIAMRGVRFDIMSDSGKTNKPKNIGFIAQELEKIIPEVVVTGSDGFKSVAYDKITAVLAEAMKEQQKQIESTKQENQKLRSELDELKALVNTLVANQTGQGNK